MTFKPRLFRRFFVVRNALVFVLSGLVMLVTGCGAGNFSGTASAVIANGALSTSALNFGSVDLLKVSQPVIVQLRNSGSGPITVSSVTISGAFKVSESTCGVPVAPSGSCNLFVVFVPTSSGTQNGILTVQTSEQLLTATLSGTGVQPVQLGVGGLSAATLAFDSVTVSQLSQPMMIQVSNTGSGPLPVSSITTAGDFKVSENDCPATLLPSSSCKVFVVFAPLAAGTRIGTLTVQTSGQLLTAALTGFGASPVQPGIGALSATSLAFGSVDVSKASQPISVQVSNTGTGPLTISSVNVAGDFKIAANTCGSTLLPSEGCGITLLFFPSAVGVRVGLLTIQSSGQLLTAALTGLGMEPVQPGNGTLSASSLEFGPSALGQTSATLPLTILNNGKGSLTLSGVTINGSFLIVGNSCGISLAPSQSCSVSVAFAPTSAGPLTGTVTFSTSSGNATTTLSGIGELPAKISLSSSILSFGDTFVGSASSQITVAVLNTGDVDTKISSILHTGDFGVSVSSCVAVLPAHKQCTLSVAFTPLSAGSLTGSLMVHSDAGDASASLSGTGQANVFTINGDGNPVLSGQAVGLTAVLNGSPTIDVTWKVLQPSPLADVGSITSSGMYTAPLTISNLQTVTIEATLKSDVNVIALTRLVLQPGIPIILSANPVSIPVASTTTVVLQGQNFSQIGHMHVDGVATSFTLLSPSSLQMTITVSSWAAGHVTITADSSSISSDSAASFTIPLSVPAVSYDAAVRFLQQAGFGATPALIAQVQQLGFEKWIDQEIQTPAYDYSSEAGLHYGQYYRNTQDGSLVLRQRTSLALSQIFVTGGTNVCSTADCGPLWEKLIERDAFGNVKSLLTDVALSPLMGAFLNNGNNAAGTTGGTPNQNFGREFMQLMTIGTVQLRDDGTTVLDTAGNPVPTYDQSNIAAMASALSGWCFPGPSRLFTLDTVQNPMIIDDSWHDMGSKTILPGITLPAGQTGTSDLNSVISTLYNHQNIAPFLSRRLIQHLVMSNPSPAYIQRISKVFEDDGSGTRGNLGAVVRATLLDSEARLGDDSSVQPVSAGHLMEPILYLSSVVNTLGGVFTDDEVRDADSAMDQALYAPPSVFSFYSPDHQLADGTPAPEAQLLDNAHAVTKMSLIYSILHGGVGGISVDLSASPFWNASSTSDLLDRINHLFFHGTMPTEMRNALSDYMADDPSKSPNAWLGDVLFLSTASSLYQVIR